MAHKPGGIIKDEWKKQSKQIRTEEEWIKYSADGDSNKK